MKVFVVGNINSGKSYYGHKLNKILINYEYLSIDDYRKKYSNGTIQSELATRKTFANDIINKDNIIVEFTGGDTITELFIDLLPNYSFVVLEVVSDLNLCINRIKDKDFIKIPYPTNNQTIEETIIKLNKSLNDNMIDLNFKTKYLKKYLINNLDEFKEIPFELYDLYFRVTNDLKNHFDYIFTYGSLGRNELKNTSDLDFYIISSLNIYDLINDFKLLYKDFEVFKHLNQIIIHKDNIFVEITVIKSLEEAKRNYMMSEISDVKITIVKGDAWLYKALEGFVLEYKPSIKANLNQTLERLVYYQRKIRWVIKKNDLYKFNYYNNIIIHEFIKVKYYLNNEYKYSYLPKDALKYLTMKELHCLKFDYDDNLINHCNNLDELIDTLLIEVNNFIKNKDSK